MIKKEEKKEKQEEIRENSKGIRISKKEDGEKNGEWRQ